MSYLYDKQITPEEMEKLSEHCNSGKNRGMKCVDCDNYNRGKGTKSCLKCPQHRETVKIVENVNIVGGRSLWSGKSVGG
jgi:recombinational DNA repair protein RecR